MTGTVPLAAGWTAVAIRTGADARGDELAEAAVSVRAAHSPAPSIATQAPATAGRTHRGRGRAGNGGSLRQLRPVSTRLSGVRRSTKASTHASA
jgi:hypothetical protein